MIAETYWDSNENSEKPNENPTTSRKRYARKSSIDCSRAKKLRYDRNYDHIAQLLRENDRIHDDDITMIDKLEGDLGKLKDEKKTLQQENATLIQEKRVLVALGNAKNEEQETFEEEKKMLMEKISALEKEKEKKAA